MKQTVKLESPEKRTIDFGCECELKMHNYNIKKVMRQHDHYGLVPWGTEFLLETVNFKILLSTGFNFSPF